MPQSWKAMPSTFRLQTSRGVSRVSREVDSQLKEIYTTGKTEGGDLAKRVKSPANDHRNPWYFLVDSTTEK